MDGAAAAGASTLYARGDHRHPSDTTKADTSYVNTQDALKVAKAGDTMSGQLISTSFKSNTESGVIVVGYAGTGSPNYQFLVYGNMPPGVDVSIQHMAVVGVWSGLRVVHAGQVFDFRHDGQAYKAGGGPWADISDARTKNVVADYTLGLAEIAQLRPVVYTFKGNDTDAPPKHHSDTARDEEIAAALADAKGDPVVPYPNSVHYAEAIAGKQRVGLLAQETETVFPGTVKPRKGYIDGVAVDDLRDFDTSELLFALINSCRELKARIEALEAGAT